MGVSENLTMKLLLVCVAAVIISASSAEWTCDDCTAVVNSMSSYLTSEEGLHKQIDILLTIQGIVEALSGDAFCAQEQDPERCASVIEGLIPFAMSAFSANPDMDAGKKICNDAFPDICS